MIPVSDAYKIIMDRQIRNRAFLEVTMSLLNQDAQQNASINGEFMSYADPSTIWDDTYASDINYATLEQNYFKADGTMYFLPSEGMETLPQNVITEGFLGSVTITLSVPHDIRGLTIDFGNEYPTEFELQSGTDTFHYINDKRIFTMDDTLFNCSSIIISPLSMRGGQQRLRIYNFKFGFTLTFDNENTASFTYTDYTQGISEELPDTNISIDVLDYDEKYNVDDPDSLINFFETGQTVNVKVGLLMDDDITIEWLNLATLYMQSWSESKYNMTFKACDIFNFLTGVYSGSNHIYERTLHDEAVTVLTAAGITNYWLDDCLKDITIINPLPELSYAECLQLIANAGRCVVYQDNAGKLIVKAHFATVIDPEDITVTSTGGASYCIPKSVLSPVDGIYAHLSEAFWVADGNMYFLPSTTPYLNAGFISAEVADADGAFLTPPTITFDLGGAFSYQSLIIVLESNGAEIVTINTELNSENVETVTFTNLTKGINICSHSFLDFDTITVEFTKGSSNSIMYVRQITFGDMSDYVFRQFDMTSFVKANKNERISTVRVKQFTYEEDEQHVPKEVEDSVFTSFDTDYQGQVVTYENVLIHSAEHAELIAEWIANYYQNNIEYDIEFRGDPRIEATDIVMMQDNQGKKIQVDVQQIQLNFNGTFSGSATVRQALNNIEAVGG